MAGGRRRCGNGSGPEERALGNNGVHSRTVRVQSRGSVRLGDAPVRKSGTSESRESAKVQTGQKGPARRAIAASPSSLACVITVTWACCGSSLIFLVHLPEHVLSTPCASRYLTEVRRATRCHDSRGTNVKRHTNTASQC